MSKQMLELAQAFVDRKYIARQDLACEIVRFVESLQHCSAVSADETRIPLADHDEIGRKVLKRWEKQPDVMLPCAGSHTTGEVASWLRASAVAEPVGFACGAEIGVNRYHLGLSAEPMGVYDTPVYTHPAPAAEPVACPDDDPPEMDMPTCSQCGQADPMRRALKPATVRSSGPAEQDSNSRVWTAGIDAERSYPGAEPSLHLNAIEFHHVVREEAEATRDRWLAAALAVDAEPGK